MTRQFPALSKLRVDPATVQFSGDVLVKVTAPPLDAVAVRVKLLVAISAVGEEQSTLPSPLLRLGTYQNLRIPMFLLIRKRLVRQVIVLKSVVRLKKI